MKRIEQYKYLFVFLIAFLFSVILYFPARQAMLIDDGISGIWEIVKNKNGGFWRAYNFDSFYYVVYGFIIILHKLFHLNSTAWFLVFVGMHALNTTLIFNCCVQLKKRYPLNTFFPIASAVLFMTSVYQSENVIWAATQHYAIGLILFLLSFRIILNITVLNRKSILLLLFFYLLSLFTIEMAFLFPLAYLATVYFLHRTQKVSLSLKEFIYKITLPQIGCSIVYIVLLYTTRHTIVPHGGTLERFNLFTVDTIHNSAIVFIKIFGYLQYLPFATKQFLLTITHNTTIALGIMCIPFLLAYLLKQKNKNAYLYLFFLAVAFIFLIPFLNGFFATLFRYENDRYQYFASVFLYLSLAYLLSCTGRYIRLILISFLLLINIYFTYDNALVRQDSGLLHNSFIHNYPFDNSKKTYIINTPCNLKGAYVFRAYYRLPIAYETIMRKSIFDTQIQIVSYIAQTPLDTFEVKRINDSCFDIRSLTNGVWYVHNDVGAIDYTTPDYVFKMTQWGFTIQFTHRLSKDERLLLFNKGKFETISP